MRGVAPVRVATSPTVKLTGPLKNISSVMPSAFRKSLKGTRYRVSPAASQLAEGDTSYSALLRCSDAGGALELPTRNKTNAHVRFGSKADLRDRTLDVRFSPKSGQPRRPGGRRERRSAERTCGRLRELRRELKINELRIFARTAATCGHRHQALETTRRPGVRSSRSSLHTPPAPSKSTARGKKSLDGRTAGRRRRTSVEI